MKSFISVLVVMSFALFSPASLSLISAAHAQNQTWITQYGTSRYDEADALAPDGAGGVLVAGTTDGSLARPNSFFTDAFLARHNGAGVQLWIRQFGTSGIDEILAATPDGAGGVVVAGSTTGSLGATGAGSWDVFLAHYDRDGFQLWIRQIGSVEEDVAYALAPDGAGGVMVAGSTRGSLGGPNAGSKDVFLARYDGAGERLWIRQFGTSEDDLAFAAASDGAGGLMVAGYTRGDLAGPNAGGRDVFLARFNSLGDMLWIRQFGSVNLDQARAMVPDGAGGVIIAGPGGDLLEPGPSFVARYDRDGNRLWFSQFGSSSFVVDARALAPDGAGGVIVAGDKNTGLSRSFDVMLARYDGAGNQLWIQQFGTTKWDSARALAADGAGGVMVTGFTLGSWGGPNAGNSDVYLARHEIDSCYADCDQSTGVGVLDLFDFLCFQSRFVNGEPYACDCDMSTGPLVCDLFDFLCFQNAYVIGCP